MNRRAFLALVTTAPIIAPEPVRRYFFAPHGGWLGVDWGREPGRIVYSWGDVVLTFRDGHERVHVLTPANLHGMTWRRP